MDCFQKDKNKDLSWTHTFLEECVNEEGHREWAKRGYLTTTQALKERNMSLCDFKDHKEALEFVKELWEKNAESHGTKDKFPAKEDPKKRSIWYEFYFVLPQMTEDELVTKDKKKYRAQAP